MQDPIAQDADTLCFGLHPDVTDLVVADRQAALHLTGDLRSSLEWNLEQTGLLVRRLRTGGLALDDWLDQAASASDGGAEAGDILAFLLRGRLLIWWHGTPDRRELIIEPVRGSFDPTTPVDPGTDLTLSELAVVSHADGEVVLNEPLAPVVLRILPSALSLLPAILACGRDPDDPAVPVLPPAVRDTLARCGVLRPRDADAPFAAAWTPWEWWLHHQLRDDGHLRRVLASSRRAKVPRVLERQVAPRETATPLPPRAQAQAKVPFDVVMESRRSLREPTETPLTRDHLGSLLWSVARYRDDRPAPDPALAFRNIPLAGALGEIEFYVAVHRCEGLERGFYFYDGTDHVLGSVAEPGEALDAMLKDVAKRLFIGDAIPDVVVVLSTRQARLSQKYYGGAYRLTLIHVGIVYEALYLAATELGLSPCAVGFADIGHFARLTGRHPFAETSIGEFALSGPVAG